MSVPTLRPVDGSFGSETVPVAGARQYIYLFGAPKSVPLFCHSRRYLLSRAMEGGERDLKKRLKTTAAAMQGGGHDLKRIDEAMVVTLETQPSSAGKERSKKKIVRKLKQEVIDLIM